MLPADGLTPLRFRSNMVTRKEEEQQFIVTQVLDSHRGSALSYRHSLGSAAQELHCGSKVTGVTDEHNPTSDAR